MDPTSDNGDRPAESDGGEGRGSIAERRAAKCGFNAERINTLRFRTDIRDGPSIFSPPVVRSPLLTIPPGISPTALLDSPILLPNSQPSPTTGFAKEGGGFGRAKEDNGLFFDDAFSEFSGFYNQGNDGDLHAVVSSGTLMDFEFPTEFPKGVAEDDLAAGVKVLESRGVEDCSVGSQDHCPEVSANRSDQQFQPARGGSVEAQQPVEEHKGSFPVADAGRTSEDGYNWRKYGQKQVKGSEYPRSYYKCSHTNCQVKKKIERSHDGRITEIIYKGNHNHPKPQPNRRALPATASSLDGLPETEEDSGTSFKPEGVAAWRSAESGSLDFRYGVSERRFDGMERTSSTSVVTELSDPQATQGGSAGALEPAGTPELSSTLASLDDNDDDGATQAGPRVRLDFDAEESESKRRRIDNILVEANMTSRAVREPRVVVQIESEVDILDDGYRWRKYGQKVVKGNPNPRSYYKCTSPGCLVRKHVERASHNLKFVITTYEGKHNHEIPAARNSTHANSTTGSSLPPNPSNAHTSLGYGRSTNGPKPDSQMQDFAPAFDRKPMFNNYYLRPAFPRNFGNGARLGPSSMYPMKFPAIQTAMPYGPFGCNSNQAPMHHPASIASLVPDFPITLPSSIRVSPNISMGGVDFHSNGKFTGQVQQFLSAQQMIRPKQEQKENIYDVGSSITDQTNVSSGSASTSLYQQIMGRFSS